MDSLELLRSGQLAGATRLDLACGLNEFPREIFDLADTLEILNLSHNHLSSLPADFGRLHRLRILFCSYNGFDHLPAVVGECPRLRMIGFRANRIQRVEAAALSPSLQWLILTENEIGELPASIGRCHALRKLMLSGNRLQSLPEEMAACRSLEMLRIAANRFQALPDWLLTLPKLAWLAMAGNPLCMSPLSSQPQAMISWRSLHIYEQLGEGASGVIHRASLEESERQGEQVAVKVFKSATTSDGLAESEIAASLCAGRHPHLIQPLGSIAEHPEGKLGLAMELIGPLFRALAGPPNFDTCTRDVYAEGHTWTPAQVLRIAFGVASAAEHLHSRGILHGDLYAHNVLYQEHGDCLLSDLGAAACYDQRKPEAAALQGLEVRAFGYLLEELLQRVTWPDGDANFAIVRELTAQCLCDEVLERPTFSQIANRLRELLNQGLE